MNGNEGRIVPERAFRACTEECIAAHRARLAPGCSCGMRGHFVNPEVQAFADALEKRNGHIELWPLHRMKPA